MREELAQHGLRITDFGRLDHRVAAEDIAFSTDPSVMRDAGVVLVTVKSGATREIADLIGTYAPAQAVIVSLQNGVSNAERLRGGLPQHRVLAGMVPFNVLHMGGGRFHRGTSGEIVIEAGVPGLRKLLSVPGLPVLEDANLDELLWGKLLLNLNNALNALSGLPLREQLADRAWRRILAAQIEEALLALKTPGIRPRKIGLVGPRLLPKVLRLPTPLFRLVAARNLKIDPQARSSMWEDLERGRSTEIGELQGAVVRLAERVGRPAPVNARVAELIRAAERGAAGSPRLGPNSV